MEPHEKLLINQKIDVEVKKRRKLALLVKSCEDIIKPEAFDYVALFSSTPVQSLRVISNKPKFRRNLHNDVTIKHLVFEDRKIRSLLMV